MTVSEIFEIVRMDALREILDFAVIAACALFAALALWPLLKTAYRKFKSQGVAFVLIALGFLYAAATKPPPVIVTWDTGLTGGASTFDTNNWSHVTFAWNKAAFVKNSEPLYFAARHKDTPDVMPTEIGETTAGTLTWDYTWAGGENATNYHYYAYMAGSGGGTNNVWNGDILIKANGAGSGVDKMVIIRSKFEVKGKQILPFKEAE